jgi:hypothetical protein
MHYVLNRLKKSKMGKIGLKSGEIVKIGRNRAKSRFQDRFCDFAKMRRWNKIPPLMSSCQTPIGFFLHSHGLTWLSSVFTSGENTHNSQINLHKSQRTKYSFQPNKSLIGNHKSGDNDLHPPQKRPATVLTVRWLQSSLLLFPQCSRSRLPLLFIVILTATSRQRSPQQLTASGFLCSLH